MIKHFPGCKDDVDEESETETFSLSSIQILQMVVSIVNKKKNNEYPFNASFQFNKLSILSLAHGRLELFGFFIHIQYEGAEGICRRFM